MASTTLTIGSTHTCTCLVDEARTAAQVGSGLLPVFATPSMIALMEQAASELAAPTLDAGMSTVGICIDCTHSRASAIGAKISATATLLAIDGRRLVFEVVASDEQGVIGKAEHERFIIDSERFMAKLKPQPIA